MIKHSAHARWPRVMAILALAALSATPALAADPPVFRLLGDAPGGPVFSDAQAVTPDGRIVVGVTKDADGEIAFKWTEADGMVLLGRLPGGVPPASQAVSISDDGLTIAGFSSSARGPYEPVLFTPSGIIQLGTLRAPTVFGACSSITPDGSVVVGMSMAESNTIFHGFRWSQATGLIDIPPPPGFSGAQASGISPCGSVIVGSVGTNFFATQRPFVWTRSGGMTVLGILPGAQVDVAEARASTMGGRHVIGYSYSARANPEAFIWNAQDGMVGLGDLDGGNAESYARAVSADGRVVVGIATTGTPDTPAGYEAFYWTQAGGMRRLADVLTENGLSTNTWVIERAQAITPDGRVIVGSCRWPGGAGNAVAFMARLPAPPPPRDPADWNDDGIVSIDDLFLFMNDYFTGDADFNEDGITTIDDLFLFFNAWF